jgi:hypothetical protein
LRLKSVHFLKQVLHLEVSRLVGEEHLLVKGCWLVAIHNRVVRCTHKALVGQAEHLG